MEFHPVTFTNPADGSTYVWPLNPAWDVESRGGSGFQQRQRQIERTSNTGNIGATRQQGDEGPFVVHWEFPVMSAAHETELWRWYQLCKTQSIYLSDFAADVYEGQIITLGRAREGVLGGLPGDVGLRGFYVHYTFEFEVWRFVSGVLASAGVRP